MFPKISAVGFCFALTSMLWPQAETPWKKLGHESPVTSLAYSPNGSILAVGTGKGPIILWDSASGKEIGRLVGHGNTVLGLAFSPDGQTLASGSQDYSIRLWDVARLKEVRVIRRPEAVYNVAFSHDGKMLAAAGWYYEFNLFDVATGGQVRQVSIPDMAMALVFAPDNKTVIGGIREGRAGGRMIRRWDVGTGKEIAAWPGHTRNLTSLALSPDGRVLASGAEDGKVGLWDLVTGQSIYWLLGHKNPVSSVAFSPDGRLVASAGGDKSVRIWDVAGGKEIRRFDHLDHVRPVSFSPNGKTLAIGGADKTLILLDVAGLSRRSAKTIRLTPKELEGFWNDLASGNAAVASQATWTLAAAPKQAVPFLKEKLPPATTPPNLQKRLQTLIADLNHDEFARRQKASEALAKLGKLAEPTLRQALLEPASLEAQRRLKSLLERLQETVPTPERLRAYRTITVLEWIATPEARQVLQGLAKGAPGAWETEEAKAVLKRLGK